ncbi:MAG TPA: hypothetical protein VN025_14625 [Candidatus Dormibacteraeota bacterium]|jgi:hypothetical protein|nr:hypothetical protein [Candidatus Dormibacteraeota bacterium]
MLSKFMLLSVLIGFGACRAAQAQQPSPAETTTAPATTVANAAPVAAPVQKLVLKEGSDVQLKFAQDVTSKTAAEGDTVNLVLDQDLKLGDVVIAKAGAKAVGTISHSKKAGMIGRAGELNMRLEYLLLDDGRLKLRGSKGREGEGKEGTAVALTVLFGPIGLIKHGKNVEIKQGTPLAVYTDENYTVPTTK